ncbi:MAG: gamma-glutamyl-gamma-aminobutyrate hydrolase family protein [Bdellovibrionota bacterium]
MTYRPKIAVACWLTHDDEEQLFVNGVFDSYLRALEAAGGIPLIIPVTSSSETRMALLSLADGLMLTGGGDIDPSLFNEAPHRKLGKTTRERDLLEIELTKAAWDRSLPIFGICRGVQILNVALGGTLFQDLGTQRPGGLEHANHDDPPAWTALRHEMQLVPDSRLARLFRSEKIRVNSLHHQAPNQIAPGLRVTGLAEDGVVEALEALDERYAVGVQCHPEMLWESADPRWLEVYRDFIDACRKRRA